MKLKTVSSIMRRFLAVSILLLPCLLTAAEKAPYKPKLTNSKNQSFQDFPMGVLSATGRLEDKEKQILVMDVGKGGAGERGGLRTGDRILSIQGKYPGAFSMKTDTGLEGPQAVLGETLNTSCAAITNQMELQVQRDDKKITLKVRVPKSPAFASSFPNRCAKSKTYLKAIADHLVDIQQKDGRWKPGVGGDADVYMSAFCGLTLIAADNRAHLPAIKRAINFIQTKSISKIKLEDPKVGPKNWQTASSAIFLAEYQLATGDDAYFKDLAKCCDLLTARVTERGTMGHHFAIPYNGGGLVIINTQVHLAWALASRCGYKINRGAWDRSLKEVEASIHKKTGAIGYSSRARSSPDISARTGAMACALAVIRLEPRLAKQLGDSLVNHPNRMRHAHAMSSIGLIYGISGIRMTNPAGYRKVMQIWKPYLELCRTSAGPAAYFGSKRNYGGDSYLGLHPIGNATVGLMLASTEGRLFMQGGTKVAWFGGRPGRPIR